MKLSSHRVEEILVLAQLPEDCETVLGWCPFDPGLELGDILFNFQEQCQEILNANTPSEYLPCAEAILPRFEAVLGQPTGEEGLSCHGDGLDGFHPALTKIIIFDGNAIEAYRHLIVAIEYSLSALENRGLKSPVQLILLDHSNGLEQRNYPPLASWPGNIHRCRNQEEIEATLRRFGEIFGNAWWGVARNPYNVPCQNSIYHEPYVHPRHSHFIMPHSVGGEIIGRVYRNYQDLVPELTSQVRDGAIAKGLALDQTRILGQAAAMQEFLLLLAAEQAHLQIEAPISTEGIRQGMDEIPLNEQPDPLKVYDVEILLIKLLPVEPSPDVMQAEILSTLNLGGAVKAAILPNRNDVRDQIGLVADLVATDSFKVTLPHWETESILVKVGLNERALGIRIVE